MTGPGGGGSPVLLGYVSVAAYGLIATTIAHGRTRLYREPVQRSGYPLI